MTVAHTVLIADADATWCATLRQLLRRIGYETLEAATGGDALAAAREHRPGLVVIDVSLPGISGYEVCRELRESFGEGLPIVFTSADRTESLDRVGGLLLGADDYVVKPCDAGELAARIRRLLPIRSALSTSDGNEIWLLTGREREVLALLASGVSTKEIAEELVISPNTVGAHMQRILNKLNVHSQAQAVVKAYREGFVQLKSPEPPRASERLSHRFVRSMPEPVPDD